MKVHLYKGDNLLGLTRVQCGYIVGKWEVEKYETIDHNAVTCKNCRKTQVFRDLEKLNNETKKAIEEMNEIKDEAIKKFKDEDMEGKKESICKSCKGCPTDRKSDKQVQYDFTGNYVQNCTHYKPMQGIEQPTTYKQKIEIEIDVPVGYEVVSFTEPVKGDLYLDSNGFIKTLKASALPFNKIIVKKKVKSGAELIGCLCGVAKYSIADVKSNALIVSRTQEVVDCYSINNEHRYIISNGGHFEHAYPVPADKLNELKANLEREV